MKPLAPEAAAEAPARCHRGQECRNQDGNDEQEYGKRHKHDDHVDQHVVAPFRGKVHNFEGVFCGCPQHLADVPAGFACFCNQVNTPVCKGSAQISPNRYIASTNPVPQDISISSFLYMRGESRIFRTCNNMHGIGKSHTGIIHASKVPEEIRESIFQVFYPHLLFKVKECDRNNRNQDGKDSIIINKGRGKQDSNPIRHHR